MSSALFHCGNMADWKTRHSTKLFAERVMPHLRTMWPDWDGDDRWWIRPLAARVRAGRDDRRGAP